MIIENANDISFVDLALLEADYEASRRLTARYGATYYLSTVTLPQPLRNHVFGLFGFLRQTDEIVENSLPNVDPQNALEHFRTETLRAIQSGRSDIPALNAFAQTAMACDIPEEYPLAFLEAMFLDLNTTCYETITDLQNYTFGSASVVGLMMCQIIGVTEQAALSPVCDLGFAMQLTNFLRDVGEDWRNRGRIYLPQTDMERFGYTRENLALGVVNDQFRELMSFEIMRARRFYAAADEGMQYIPIECRNIVILARNLYSKILDKIEQNDFDVFTSRSSSKAC